MDAPNTRICFLGAPGTGKSTLAQALVPQMKLQGLDAEFQGEYGRTYLRRFGAPESLFEEFMIFNGNCQREDEMDVHDYVITDSASFNGAVYFSYVRHKLGLAAPDATAPMPGPCRTCWRSGSPRARRPTSSTSSARTGRSRRGAPTSWSNRRTGRSVRW